MSIESDATKRKNVLYFLTTQGPPCNHIFVRPRQPIRPEYPQDLGAESSGLNVGVVRSVPQHQPQGCGQHPNFSSWINRLWWGYKDISLFFPRLLLSIPIQSNSKNEFKTSVSCCSIPNMFHCSIQNMFGFPINFTPNPVLDQATSPCHAPWSSPFPERHSAPCTWHNQNGVLFQQRQNKCQLQKMPTPKKK